MKFKAALLIATIIATNINGKDMKLVEKETGQAIIEFKDKAVIFHCHFLEKALREGGILIPPIMKRQFDGKEVVFVDDPLFEKAFVKVYWPMYMETANCPFGWQN
jgi:hypothetical protein